MAALDPKVQDQIKKGQPKKGSKSSTIKKTNKGKSTK